MIRNEDILTTRKSAEGVEESENMDKKRANGEVGVKTKNTVKAKGDTKSRADTKKKSGTKAMAKASKPTANKTTKSAKSANSSKSELSAMSNTPTKTTKKASKTPAEPEVSLEELAEALSTGSRKDRQNAAAKIAEISKESPGDLLPYGSAIVDALKRPEARTRWECFDALTNLVELDSKTCRRALDSAEESVFDETSGTVRLAAMRFLCKLGTASPRLATSSWPLIDEALQCYHGDPEYTDMLVAVNDFATSKLPKQVREELVARMEFDATNPKSGLVRRANSIIDAALKGRARNNKEANDVKESAEADEADSDSTKSTSDTKKAVSAKSTSDKNKAGNDD